ncbi:transcriptional regulator, LysR family [Polaromonas sp. JS666]|nr:transcriptional regulator, LysR family [Polaromonas sp. JS666]
MDMKRACPTIQELLAFDAVARHGSLTRAAGALCVSVSGISKQLAGLESFVGHPLLEKQGRGVQLTTIGREYWTKIGPSLRTIETASFEAKSAGSGAGVLSLASVPTFLTKWLIPRLADFRRLHPGVTFSFSQHLGSTEPHPTEIDAAIRYGSAVWPGVESEYIAGREFVCVCSTEHLQSRRWTPKEVLKQTLLHHDQAPAAWAHWAERHGIDDVHTLAGPRFAQYSALIQAVLSGLGIGLVPKILIEEELAEKRAIALGEVVVMDQGHYLCFMPNRLDRPIFAAFRTWILQEGKGSLSSDTAP